MDYEPENLDSPEADSEIYDSRYSFRQREGRRGRINLLNFMLRGKLRDISGLALILFAILAIAAVILLLVALIAFVVQQSSESANFVPTASATPTIEEPAVTAIFTPLPRPTIGTVSPGAILSPTATISLPPDEISPGGFVAIQGTNSLGLRFRVGPGLNYATTDVYDEGARFKVLEGPELADEINWWRLEGEDGTIGWAAGEFLEPVNGFAED